VSEKRFGVQRVEHRLFLDLRRAYDGTVVADSWSVHARSKMRVAGGYRHAQHLGEQERIVGISNLRCSSTSSAQEKPVVSGLHEWAVLPKSKHSSRDLVIGFSDVQAKFAAELIGAGLPSAHLQPALARRDFSA